MFHVLTVFVGPRLRSRKLKGMGMRLFFVWFADKWDRLLFSLCLSYLDYWLKVNFEDMKVHEFAVGHL